METTSTQTMNTRPHRPGLNRTAFDRLLALAREQAADGPADRHHDCSPALNALVRAALEAAEEDAGDYHEGWDDAPR